MKPGTIERIYPSLGDNYKKPSVLLIIRVILSVAMLVVAQYVKLSSDIGLAIRIAAALISGYDIVINAVKDVLDQVYIRENLTVAVAVILSFSIGRAAEAVIALLLLQLSYMMRDYALFKTRKMICEVIEPDRRMLKGPETGEKGESQPEYPVGSRVIVYEGMAVPVDCVIKEGSGSANMSFITGSDRKVRLNKGDYLPAGSVCAEGQFIAEAAQIPENALYRKAATLLKSGYGEMTDAEKKWTRVTELFVPVSLGISIILMIVLPFVFKINFSETVRRIITIIAISSPCGVLLSIPLTFFSGAAAGRRAGVLFSHAKALENSAAIKALVFNKTGTLTDRNYLVTDIRTDRMDPKTFLKVAAYAVANSENDMAKAIVNAFGEQIDTTLVNKFIEYPGKGVSVTVDNIQILLGSSDFLSENGAAIPDDNYKGTRLYMTVNGIYAGGISLSETVKSDVSIGYFNNLTKLDVGRIAMVSSDSREKDRQVASELGIDEYFAECSDEDKIQCISELKGRIDSKGTLAFVCDRQSDSKLFETVDVGIVIGGASCDNELPKADIVIMENGISPIPSIIRIARRTRTFVTRGVIFACSVKVIILVLALLGYAPIWFGLLIDFCASLAVLLNCTCVYSRDTSN